MIIIDPIALDLLIVAILWAYVVLFTMVLAISWPDVVLTLIATIASGICTALSLPVWNTWGVPVTVVFGIATVGAAIRRLRRTPAEQRAARSVWR